MGKALRRVRSPLGHHPSRVTKVKARREPFRSPPYARPKTIPYVPLVSTEYSTLQPTIYLTNENTTDTTLDDSMASHQHTGPSQVPPPRTKQVPQSPQRQTAEEIRSQVEQNSTREPNPFSVFREAQDKEAKQPATKKALSLNNILTRPDHEWRVIAVEPTVHQSQAEHNSTREPNPFRAVAGRIISLIPAQPPSSSNRWKSTEDDAASSFSPSKARTPTSPPPTENNDGKR